MLKLMPSFVGRALHGVRPGLGRIVANDGEMTGSATESLVVHSPAFTNHDDMPRRFTADGDGVSPPIEWEAAPRETKELVLLIEDADSSMARPLVHCVAYAIAPMVTRLAEGALSGSSGAARPATLGHNSFSGLGYLPPNPPPGQGRHRYCFEVFALDCELRFRHIPDRGDVRYQMRKAIIGFGYTVGLYSRGALP